MGLAANPGLSPGNCPLNARPGSLVGQIFVGGFPTSLSGEHTFHSCGEQQEDCVLWLSGCLL